MIASSASSKATGVSTATRRSVIAGLVVLSAATIGAFTGDDGLAVTPWNVLWWLVRVAVATAVFALAGFGLAHLVRRNRAR